MRISELAQRRVDGTFLVDEWGFDHDLTRVVSSFAALRWSAWAARSATWREPWAPQGYSFWQSPTCSCGEFPQPS